MARRIAKLHRGRNIADAAATVETLENFAWSTLPSASIFSEGRAKVPHMDGKARVDDYVLECLPSLAQKMTFYWGGFFADNVTYPSFRPNILESAGKCVWVQPVAAETVVPMVGDHTVNTGIFVQRILRRPDVCLPGKYVLGVVDWLANGELLRMLEIVGEREGRNKDTVYVHSDVETVSKLWPGIGEDLGGMLKLLEELGKKAWRKDGMRVLTMQTWS